MDHQIPAHLLERAKAGSERAAWEAANKAKIEEVEVTAPTVEYATTAGLPDEILLWAREGDAAWTLLASIKGDGCVFEDARSLSSDALYLAGQLVSDMGRGHVVPTHHPDHHGGPGTPAIEVIEDRGALKIVRPALDLGRAHAWTDVARVDTGGIFTPRSIVLREAEVERAIDLWRFLLAGVPAKDLATEKSS